MFETDGINKKDFQLLLRTIGMVFLLISVFIFGALSVKCQTIKEKLPDNSYIVEIEGKEYRAFDAEKMRELAVKSRKAEGYDELKKVFEDYKRTSLALLKDKENYYGLEIQKRDNLVSFWKDEYLKQKTLSEKIVKERPRCTSKILIFRLCL